MAASAQGRAVILLYHRVATPASDPWELAVTPAQFEEHLDALSAFGPIVPVGELARGIESGTLTGLSFGITFDDGYADNLHAALPALEARGAPATVFVTTGCIGGTPFWWDELAELMIDADELPEELELQLGGTRHAWRPGELGSVAAYEQVWAALQPLDDVARREAVSEVRAQVAPSPAAEEGRSLTADELVELARGGLVEVGAHTKTHPILAVLGADEAREEIAGSKAWLEDLLARRVGSFSYPFGGPEHYGDRDVELVRGAGFDLACSAVAGVTRPGADLMQLARLPVGNWSAEMLERKLSKLVGLVEHEAR